MTISDANAGGRRSRRHSRLVRTERVLGDCRTCRSTNGRQHGQGIAHFVYKFLEGDVHGFFVVSKSADFPNDRNIRTPPDVARSDIVRSHKLLQFHQLDIIRGTYGEMR